MHQGAISKLRKHQMQAHWLLQAAGQSQHFLWSVCEMVPPPSLVSPGFPVCVVLSKLKQGTSGKNHCSFVPSFRCLFLASARVTVYSNHRMFGIRLVSRIRKNSEIGHAAILGKSGVSNSCVKINQATAMILPATPPFIT